MRLNRRMSISSAPSVAIWPPMLWRAPPMETGPGELRTAVTISSVVVGVSTRPTAIGLSWVTSLTTSGGVSGSTGSRTTLHTVTPAASDTVSASPAARSLSDLARMRVNPLICGLVRR